MIHVPRRQAIRALRADMAVDAHAGPHRNIPRVDHAAVAVRRGPVRVAMGSRVRLVPSAGSVLDKPAAGRAMAGLAANAVGRADREYMVPGPSGGPLATVA